MASGHSGRESGVFKRIKRRTAEWLYHGRGRERLLPGLLIAVLILDAIYFTLFAAPAAFTARRIINIPEGQGLRQTALELQQAGVIRSAYIFNLLMRALGGNRRIHAGSYSFAGGENMFLVAHQLATGDFELQPVRISIPEGASVKDIAAVLSRALAPFDSAAFLALAQPREGHLYPDTYFFYPAQDPASIEHEMENDFDTHFSQAAPQIAAFGKPPEEDLIMASILVGEASTFEDRRIVAGILWKRISLGIPLQVDAPFGYIYDKPLTELTSSDLKVDSPYNTYLYRGLPPTPINNPSLAALEAAVTPIKTSYLYYLSDKKGTMHYSATYAQHLRQIAQYLR